MTPDPKKDPQKNPETDSPNPSNQLSRAASPYLRSAAQQPVAWMEWGPQAFALAKAEDKPILLDIGAVWCHWCHVIDRESYEDPELAALINHIFVAVKVDRDERPDVDARYQTAVSALSGQGGWPLTGFLLPDGRPFYGGTYFPPEDAMGRPSFRRVLESVGRAFRDRRDELERSAGALAGVVAQAETFSKGRGEWNASLVEPQVTAILDQFDPQNGGFGHGPKFPHSATIDLLMERYQSTRAPHLLHAAQFTLEKMAKGGVYDQIAGGFHRYSVDALWRVPHFEKMSYDNSELLKNYVHAYQVTRNPLFGDIAAGIIAWTDSVLSDQENGGFYGSQDADISLDDDGDYFTWTQEEVRAVLPAEEARVIELYYDVEPHGEMHHNPAKNVLWVAREPGEIAESLKLSVQEVERIIRNARARLLAARNNRPTPFIDTTLYVSWNALFVSAYFAAAGALEGALAASCGSFAVRTLDRILAEGWDDKRGFAHRLGGDRLEGTLDDQVFTAAALLDGFEATLDRRYFDAAEAAMKLVLDQYADAQGGGFFDRAADAEPLGGLEVRRKPLQDSPTPGGNSIAAMVLDRLYDYAGERRYHDAAQATLEAFAASAPNYGLFTATYGLATVLHARGPIQIVVTGSPHDETAARLERAARSFYRFGKAVLRFTPETSPQALLPRSLGPTLEFMNLKNPEALVCAGGTCYPPIRDPEHLSELLGKLGAASQAAGPL